MGYIAGKYYDWKFKGKGGVVGVVEGGKGESL